MADYNYSNDGAVSSSDRPVHNHPPYHPLCNEHTIDGNLMGDCLMEQKEFTDEGWDREGDFTAEQSQRASAVYHARSVLEKRGGIAFAPTASSQPPNVNDLITVAEWIMTGRVWEE